jgi:hypothetical protein
MHISHITYMLVKLYSNVNVKSCVIFFANAVLPGFTHVDYIFVKYHSLAPEVCSVYLVGPPILMRRTNVRVNQMALQSLQDWKVREKYKM